MKKYFIFIFCLFIFICIDNVYALECVEFKKGNGTENNPYIITTPIELYSISCKAE